MAESFKAYRRALDLWETIGETHPALTAIPDAILSDTSAKGKKAAARMKRNYRFDRARYYLPAAAATNMMLIMSSRGWAQLCQHLSSHPLPEAQALAAQIRNELALSAPRLMKHAGHKPTIEQGILSELNALALTARRGLPETLGVGATSTEHPPRAEVVVSPPDDGCGLQFAADCSTMTIGMPGRGARYRGQPFALDGMRWQWARSATSIAIARETNTAR